jgi:hypothetical protein
MADYYAKYVFLGKDNYVTEQAFRAAKNYQDIRALARMNLLKSVRMEEDMLDLGGNGTAVLLGTPTTPTVADSATAGSLTPGKSYDIVVVALTL